jgi:hypothetical protein
MSEIHQRHHEQREDIDVNPFKFVCPYCEREVTETSLRKLLEVMDNENPECSECERGEEI